MNLYCPFCELIIYSLYSYSSDKYHDGNKCLIDCWAGFDINGLFISAEINNDFVLSVDFSNMKLQLIKRPIKGIYTIIADIYGFSMKEIFNIFRNNYFGLKLLS